jgi:hypothetical protein
MKPLSLYFVYSIYANDGVMYTNNQQPVTVRTRSQFGIRKECLAFFTPIHDRYIQTDSMSKLFT